MIAEEIKWQDKLNYDRPGLRGQSYLAGQSDRPDELPVVLPDFFFLPVLSPPPAVN